MKILAINGSHRGERGFTQVCIERMFQGARNAGAECETVSLSQTKINRCTGCQACHTEKHFLHCVFEVQDDVKMVFEKMAKADVLIFATPVYVFGMTGLMKTFLDRINSTGDSSELTISEYGYMFHHINREICSKPFVTLVLSDNMENATSANVLHYFRTYARFMNANQVGTIVRKSGKLIGYGKDVEKEKQFPRILDVYEALTEAGSELALNGRISKRTEKRASAEIIPIPKIVSVLKRIKSMRAGLIKKMQSMNEKMIS